MVMMADGATTPTKVSFVKTKWKNFDIRSILLSKWLYSAFETGLDDPSEMNLSIRFITILLELVLLIFFPFLRFEFW